MSHIYNQTFRVPIWVVVNTKSQGHRSAVAEYLSENGALEQPWPADTYVNTVKELTKKGWAHAIGPTPFVLDPGFIMVSVASHVNSTLGANKMVNFASSTSPWHHMISRSINSDADYTRIFNEIMCLQDTITLSHMFSVAERCHSDGKKTYVFYTVGEPVTKVLHSFSNNVIVVGEVGDISISDKTPEQTVNALNDKLEQILG